VTKVSEAMAEGPVLDSIQDWIDTIDISTDDYDEHEILDEIYSGLSSRIKPFLKSIEKKYKPKKPDNLNLGFTDITRLPDNLKVGSETFRNL
jgi:hypothetical protein